MAKVELLTEINAPIEKCFDLARNISIHLESTKETSEKVIAGRTTGLMELGETITWEGKYLGIRQTLSSKITAFDYPNFFADEMVEGAFKYFRHEHHFVKMDNYTLMKDVFIFESPFGVVGKLFNRLILIKHITTFLKRRNSIIKQVAETV